MTTIGRILIACMLLNVREVSHAELSVQWARVEGKDARAYNPSAIVHGPEKSLFVAGTSSSPGFDGREPEFWLWKIDGSGARVKETVIARAEGQQRIITSADHIRDMAFEAGRGAMIVDFNLGEPYFVGFDENAQLTLMKRLEMPGRHGIILSRLIPLHDGSYVAVGVADNRGLTVRIDADGNVRGSATAKEADVFTGGAALPEGGFVALGYAKAKRGQFLLSYYGADASLQRTATFPGRKASIAIGADGTQVVSYDASTDAQQDLRIATVKTGTLSNEFAVPVVALSFQEDFRIAPTDRGSFLIAGSTQDSIVVLNYGAHRAPSLFERPTDQEPHHWMLARVLGNPATALTVVHTGDKELTTKVGVIRFRTD